MKGMAHRRWKALATLILIGWCGWLWGDELAIRRALVGTKVFGAVLAADLAIESRSAPDGTLHLLVVHPPAPEGLDGIVERVAGLGSVRGIPIHVEVIASDQLQDYAGPVLAGVYVAGALPDLQPVLALGDRYGMLIFSPILGDLGRGAHAGLSVTDRIIPVINEERLASSGIHLKSFFLEVATRYAPD